ncbi:hypothetical protein DICPUDRAFT_8673, partial [Dictyostelium purpureum]
LIQSFLNGHNILLLAYGVTNAGKTYTISGSKKNPGIIRRSLEVIFDIQMSDQYKYSIEMSYYEIHKKNLNDLLLYPNDKRVPLKIECEDKTVNIRNLQRIRIDSVEAALDIIALGEANRKVGNTKLNNKSSRSHAVLVLRLTAKPRNVPKEENPAKRCSKLCIIDLAGSERASRTEAVGDRLKEASNINTSLFILGKCIEVYVQNNSNVIPWRESDLTRICQEYFVGNGKAAMIVNVSPTMRDSEETLNVLRFSANAKEI